MQQTLDWQDLKLFCAIARGGGLAAAARDTGVSSATLGRRMTGLEATIGDRLFARGARGYSLTSAGERLLAHVATMQEAADEIALWKEADRSVQSVRISAGGWTMQFLLGNLTAYWQPSAQAQWIPEFVTDFSRRDIARREIDIGVRRGRPTEPWLAGRKVGTVDYAIYRASAVKQDDAVPVWIGVGQEHSRAATADWGRSQHGATLVIDVNMASMGLPLVRQGVARMAMPCFIGDADPALVRDSELIDEFRHERWLVVHHEHRHRAHVRAAVDALATFLAPDD